MKKDKLKAVELFAGIGGFRLGMAAANIETVWAKDLSERSCRVYESNFGRGAIGLGDIVKNNSDASLRIVTAGFPCKLL